MTSCRRGLFGGTFDPPHAGHLMIAEVARETLDLDVVEFVLSGVPPHKAGLCVSGGEQRLEMVRAAVAPFPSFTVSTMELERQGPSYTVDTVEAFRRLYPDDTLYWIIGADMLLDFPNWKRAQDLSSMLHFIAAPRPHHNVEQVAERLCRSFPGLHVTCLDMPELDISSTWIRDRLSRGLRVDPLLSAEVSQCITAKGWYGA